MASLYIRFNVSFREEQGENQQALADSHQHLSQILSISYFFKEVSIQNLQILGICSTIYHNLVCTQIKHIEITF